METFWFVLLRAGVVISLGQAIWDSQFGDYPDSHIALHLLYAVVFLLFIINDRIAKGSDSDA